MTKSRLLILLLLLTIDVYAYVPIEEYNGIRMKFYYELVPGEKEYCQEMIDTIPEEYLEGLKFVSVYDGYVFFRFTKGQTWGKYFWHTRTIHLYIGCDQETFIHELAHHRQYMLNDTLDNAYNHKGNFLEYYHEIMGKTNETFI